MTGNGGFTAASAGGRDYGDSVLKLGLTEGTLAVRDYFTPFNEARLNRTDEDLGSCGPVLLPDQPGPHPHLLVAAGKEGVLYLLDRDRLGKYHAGSDSQALQTLRLAGSGMYGAPAYWNGHLFVFSGGDVLRDWTISGDRLGPGPAHSGSYKFRNPGAIPVVSANGTKDGIVWVVLTKAWNERSSQAILQAYDAADVSHMLYTTEHDARSEPGAAVRFTMPTVANGRVYVGSKRVVYVFGLLHP